MPSTQPGSSSLPPTSGPAAAIAPPTSGKAAAPNEAPTPHAFANLPHEEREEACERAAAARAAHIDGGKVFVVV